jgi:CBS domain-containing protein
MNYITLTSTIHDSEKIAFGVPAEALEAVVATLTLNPETEVPVAVSERLVGMSSEYATVFRATLVQPDPETDSEWHLVATAGGRPVYFLQQ